MYLYTLRIIFAETKCFRIWPIVVPGEADVYFTNHAMGGC